MPGRGRKFGNQFAAHERIAMRLRRGEQAEGQCEQPVAGQNRRRLVERFVQRGFAAPHVVIVHGGKIIMH
jgi:hypothetical protein